MRYPSLYRGLDRKLYFKKTLYACQNADVIVAVSQQTKNDIIEFLGIEESKIKVIYQSVSKRFYQVLSSDYIASVKNKFNLPSDYILYVGTIEERKKLLSLVKAMKNVDIPLVVIGKKTDYYKIVASYIEQNNLSSKIIFPPFVNNDELSAIYQAAHVFVYPSIFEGFGIPILESIVSGVPVITSKGSCFSEAGGKGALYIDPNNDDEIANAIFSLMQNRELYAQLKMAGKEHSKQFDAQLLSSQMMSLYQSI